MKEEKPVRRNIKFAALKDSMIAPGVLGSETTLSPDNTKGASITDMYIEPGFLVVKAKGEELLIPLSNVKSMVVDK